MKAAAVLACLFLASTLTVGERYRTFRGSAHSVLVGLLPLCLSYRSLLTRAWRRRDSMGPPRVCALLTLLLCLLCHCAGHASIVDVATGAGLNYLIAAVEVGIASKAHVFATAPCATGGASGPVTLFKLCT